MNEDNLLLLFWWGLFFVALVLYPIVGGIRKARDYSKYDGLLKLRCSWMNDDVVFVYPGEARKKGIEGSVVMKLTFDGDGKLLNSDVIDSSSYKLLDDAAIAAVSRVSLSAISMASQPALERELKVTFRLQGM